MFYLSRRQAHAALAGVVAAAGYLAAAELGSRKPVRVSGLITLGALAMAGMAGASLNNKASVKANSAHQRIDAIVPAVGAKLDKSGGTISGNLTVNGDHFVGGQSHTHLAAPSGFANVQVQSGGIGMTGGGNIDMNGNNIVNASTIGGGGSAVALPDGSSHGNSLIMNGNNAFTFGHITSNQIGPGGNRTGLGGTATLAQLTARCDFLLAQLQNCGVCY